MYQTIVVRLPSIAALRINDMIFLVASLLNSYYLNLKVLFQERERKRGKTGEI